MRTICFVFLVLPSLFLHADEILLWNGEGANETNPSKLKYGTAYQFPAPATDWYFEGSPDPWHAPGVILQNQSWRIDLTDYDEFRFLVRVSVPGFNHDFSVYGWYMGGSSSVPIANYVAGGVLDTEWREAIIPIADLQTNGAVLNAVEALYFGRSSSNHTIQIADIRAQIAGWTPPEKEPVEAEAVPPYVSEAWMQALEGNYPITRPTLSGIESLLILSDRWLIVVVDPFEDIVAQMDLRTNGNYSETIADVEDAIKRDHQTDIYVFQKELEQFRWEHWADARASSIEPKLKNAGFYAISSSDDGNYANPLAPGRITTAHISNDHGIRPGYDVVRYGVYTYLEMPQPMQSGCTYTVTLGNGKHVSFEYDLNATVARSIKINQIGYQPGKASNRAYIGAYLQDLGPLRLDQLSSFEVVDATTGSVVFSGSFADGKLSLRDNASLMDPQNAADTSVRPYMNGEKVYEMDLSGLTQTGVFFIRVPGVGRSWPFRVGNDIYGEAFYTAMRGLFHQRASFELSATYTAWTRPRYHTNPIYESEMLPYWADSAKVFDGSTQNWIAWPRFDIIGATTATATATQEVDGGWYDAADYDRNFYHYNLIFDLLKLYEFAPHKFTDGQLHIPESGNGTPDLLDEVEYGLRIWRHSQRIDGGVSGMVETSTHPSIDDDTYPWSFAQRTRWSSLTYAAAAAELARTLAPFNAQLSQEYASSALAAYDFGINPANSVDGSTIHAATNRGTGSSYTLIASEPADHNNKFLIMAKVQLFLLTNDASYLEDIDSLYAGAAKPYVWPLSERDFSPWLYFDLAYDPRVTAQFAYVSAATREEVASDLTGAAQNYALLNDRMPYHMSWPRNQDYWMSWGASDMTNRAKVMLIANQIAPSADLRTKAELNTAYMFGANPMGMSWTTGIGLAYPVAIQHESSMTDGILDPCPGITIYGNTSSHAYFELRNRAWRYPVTRDADGKPRFDSSDPADFETFYELPEQYPVFRRWAAHPTLNVSQNEFTIHETNSSTIFVLGMLMESGWMPSESLKQRGPRNEADLFGYWYLP